MPGKDSLESPKIVEVLDVIEETIDVKTITFNHDFEAFPGQFVMVWIPGIDEVPMSLSYIGKKKGITVKSVGSATEALHKMSPGDKIGIRGPHGTYFEIKGKKLLAIAGGIGIAPLLPFMETAKEEGKYIVLAFGAKTSKELFFLNRLRNCCNDIRLATDDGSEGYHGFVSDLAKEILEKEDFEGIITCGPEIMMKKIVDMARRKKIPLQASLERYMKCGIGVCDSCAINGFHVCMDGPVFSDEILVKLSDFGNYRRDASGKRKKV